MKIQEDLLNVFDGKTTLFLENDKGLYNCDGHLESWLIENKQKYNVLYCIDQLPMEYIIEQIEWYDVIAFQTTWTYEVADNIKKLLFKHKFRQQKIIVECVSGEPTWYYLPKGMANKQGSL